MNENKKEGIRIVIIPGSVRPENFTGKAVAVVANGIKKLLFINYFRNLP